jgi:hypothetical protein
MKNTSKVFEFAVLAAIALAALVLTGCSPDGGGSTHAHVWGKWTETIPATYIAEGEETRVCTLDETHIETHAIPRIPVTSINELGTLLSGLDANTAVTAYTIALNVDDISTLKTTLDNATYKYVSLDLSGSTITEIPNNVFYEPYPTEKGCATLAGITIPSSVTAIGNYAFYDCRRLISVTILDGVTGIGDYAFAKCQNIDSVTIPASVTAIGDHAFAYCTSLTGITIPNGVTSMGQFTFAYCSRLISIAIPASVTTIEDYAFYYCDSLISVTIQNGVTTIGNDAFSHCTSLASVTIPNSVTSIGSSAFYDCTSLISVTIGNGITSIGNAFSGCSSLTSITIPDSVTTIKGWSFVDCTSLAGITIPASVTSIGDGAFHRCAGLISVTFQGTIPSSGFSDDADYPSFPGDLRDKFYTTDLDNGTPETYTRPNGESETWTRQP